MPVSFLIHIPSSRAPKADIHFTASRDFTSVSRNRVAEFLGNAQMPFLMEFLSRNSLNAAGATGRSGGIQVSAKYSSLSMKTFYLTDQNAGFRIQVGSDYSECLRKIYRRTPLGPRASRPPIRRIAKGLCFTAIAAGETPAVPVLISAGRWTGRSPLRSP